MRAGAVRPQGITRVTTSVTPAIFYFLRYPAYYALNGVGKMDESKPHVLLCFWCQRRISVDELQAGRHDHVDVQERIDYEQAAYNGID